jgi:hypothetical protein
MSLLKDRAIIQIVNGLTLIAANHLQLAFDWLSKGMTLTYICLTSWTFQTRWVKMCQDPLFTLFLIE